MSVTVIDAIIAKHAPFPGSMFVFIYDNGCEGHSAPFQIAFNEATARALWETMSAAASSSGVVVYEVPVWPMTSPVPYFNRFPVDWCLGPVELKRKRKEEERLGTSPTKA